MSKYLVDKFMRLINMNEEAEKAYVRDPAGFVDQWQRSQKRQLTEEERQALAERDYIRLYALGAHPFLLWSFTEAIWSGERPREELVRDYKEKTGQIGYPDFRT